MTITPTLPLLERLAIALGPALNITDQVRRDWSAQEQEQGGPVGEPAAAFAMRRRRLRSRRTRRRAMLVFRLTGPASGRTPAAHPRATGAACAGRRARSAVEHHERLDIHVDRVAVGSPLHLDGVDAGLDASEEERERVASGDAVAR